MKKSRLALICDYLEEGWPSMDLGAEALSFKLNNDYSGQFEVFQIRPPFIKRFSRSRCQGRSGGVSIVDRLLNRFVDYPRFLKARSNDFDVFHIVDHSYSHLVQVLEARCTLVTCHDIDAFRCVLEKQSGSRSRL